MFFCDPSNLQNEYDKSEKFRIEPAKSLFGGKWVITEERPWKYYTFPDSLPEQGWKLHVSVIPDDAEKVLNEVAPVLSKTMTSFKHLVDLGTLKSMLVKYANRAQCGKFITIYPSDDSKLADLCAELVPILKKYSGCDILTDCRIPGTTLHSRYGAFKRMNVRNDEGELVPAIKHPDGHLIPDKRETRFYIPDWVEVPDILKEAVVERTSANLPADAFDPYEIKSVMHYSNSGGVYKAINKITGEQVVIKEARPFTGLDGNGLWAQDRLRIERDVLKDLIEVKGVAKYIDYLKIAGHEFLVEELADGSEITRWTAQNYPFNKKQNPSQYLKKAAKIAVNLKTAVKQIHDAGWVMSDVQPKNIIVTSDLNVRMIDFETAVKADEPIIRGVATPGFVPY